MTAINRGQKRDGRGILLIILLVISLFLLSLSDKTTVEKPKSYGLTFLSFFQNIIHNSFSLVGDTFNSIGELRELRHNYNDALVSLENYAGLERELERLRSENQLLREQLDFSHEMDYRNVSARIIGKDPANFYNSFVINKGSRDGILHDMAVVAYDRGMFGLVGKVEEVGINSSIIIPITNSQCFVAAKLRNSRYEGLVSGSNGISDDLIMEYVNKKAEFSTIMGEPVVTSGLKSLYPPELFIGRITDYSAEEYDTSMELTLEPVIDLSQIEYVFVLTEE
ncbi:MAG: rod shape-determining protein MreC [Spirochaetales bacterium]|nr:rod shape-determining protein MreC [Spirochaetales bacterium]